MAGIDENGDPIYYPGERWTKWERIWHGSLRHGGGLISVIGPIFMIIGATIFLLALIGEFDEPVSKEPVKTEQTEI